MELVVLAAYEKTDVSIRGVNSVTEFYIRCQMRHKKHIGIYTFILYDTGLWHEPLQDEERGFVCGVCPEILFCSVVPLRVEQLEYSAQLIAAFNGKIVLAQKSVVGKVDIVGVEIASAATRR